MQLVLSHNVCVVCMSCLLFKLPLHKRVHVGDIYGTVHCVASVRVEKCGCVVLHVNFSRQFIFQQINENGLY